MKSVDQHFGSNLLTVALSLNSGARNMQCTTTVDDMHVIHST
jgi:hypothetical protein